MTPEEAGPSSGKAKGKAKATGKKKKSPASKKKFDLKDAASEAWRKKQAAKPKRKKAEPSEMIKKMQHEGRKKKEKQRREDKKVRDRLEKEALGIETRCKPLRKKPSAKVFQRLDRMMEQSMFCLHREAQSDQDVGQDAAAIASSSSPYDSSPLGETFKVCGSTGNVYTVDVNTTPSCDCPDSSFHADTVCKHILFVFIRVLGVPVDSHVWYQKGLLRSELRQIFAEARPDPSASLPSLSRAYAEHVASLKKRKPATIDLTNDDPPTGLQRQPKRGDACPICYEEFDVKDEDTTDLWFCLDSCGNPLHITCAQAWARARPEMSKPVTCIYCRSPVVIPLPESSKKNKASTSTSELGITYTNMSAHTGIINPRPAPRRGPIWEWRHINE